MGRSGASYALLTGGTFTGEVVAPDFKASGKTGATATGTIIGGGTASGAPTSGAHVKGELVTDDTGRLWFCTVSGTPGTWVQVNSTSYVAKAGSTMTGELVVPDVSVSGLTGAVTATRYVGGTAGGPPTSGTFAVGDWITTTAGGLWVCTVAGTPGTWVAVGETFIRKTADEAVTSSAALQNDDELLAALVANATYRIDGFVIFDASTAGDFKVGFTVPAGATLAVSMFGPGASASSSTATTIFNSMVGGGTSTFGGVGAGTKLGVPVKGIVRTGGTAGNLQLQWAQGTSDGTATTVYTDSYLSLRRVA